MQTPIATRFSLVTHPKGSPESLRDTRGMAVSPPALLTLLAAVYRLLGLPGCC